MHAVHCDFCGASAQGEVVPLTWTTSVERGEVLRYCDACSRAHLRAMEGKLDQAWW